MFVPFTRGSALAKELRSNEEKIRGGGGESGSNLLI